MLAKSEDEDVARANRRTRTPRVPGIEASLQHGLTKASFRLGFDVLDKLAGFINEYLEAGVSRQRVSFTRTDQHCLWWSEPKCRVVRPAIEEALRSNLGGLYDIFLDFQENAVTGEAHYQELKKMRNALTHRRLSVTSNPASGTEEDEITPEALDDATRRVLFLARCAIMYLILFVNGREHRSASKQGERG